MAVSDWDSTAGNNTTLGSISVLGTQTVNNTDNLFREMMAQIKAGVPYLSSTSLAHPATLATVAYPAGVAISWNSGDVTLTHAANSLALAGGSSGYTVDVPWRPATAGPSVAVMAGHIFGLTLSNGTDATNDIDIAAGEAADSTVARLMRLSSGITKQLDAAWAVGTAAGGLDTGTIATGTYHVWLIMRSDTGVVDVLFSTSASSPTMPSNYDFKRRIGSIIHGAGAIIPFTQDGDVFRRKLLVRSVSASDTGTSAVTAALNVPTGVAVQAMISVTLLDDTANSAVHALVTALAETDSAPTVNLHTVMTPNVGGGPQTSQTFTTVPTDTSAQIRYRLSATGSDKTVQIYSIGWVDTRGRLA